MQVSNLKFIVVGILGICFATGMLFRGSLAYAQTVGQLKDFRGTPQSVGILGASAEFVDPALKDQILQQMRKNLNRYTRSYSESAISGFKLGPNSNDQFFRPFKGAPSESQKNFLRSAAKDNSVDIIGLMSIRDLGDSINSEVEFQLFDARIEGASGIEVAQFARPTQQRALEDLAFRVMNYLDKDGYVHPDPQGILERPSTLQMGSSAVATDGMGTNTEVAINPTDLSAGTLGGSLVVAGDQIPFWEKWWFWTIVGSGVGIAGGLSYYFLVVDQPPTRARIKFNLPN